MLISRSLSNRTRLRAFTLVELLVAMVVLALIMIVVLSVIQSTGAAWKSTTDKIDAFRGARAAFETMTSQLRQATLNTYFDYYDEDGKPSVKQTPQTAPVAYGRQSELHFISGPNLLADQVTHGVFFQSPLGFTSTSNYAALNALLNTTGFYLTFGNGQDAINRPPNFLGLAPVYRYRLMQFVEPSEKLKVYETNAATPTAWFADPLKPATAKDNARILAGNIIAFVVLPKINPEQNTALTSDYRFDSRNDPAYRTSDTSIAYDWKPGVKKQPLPMNQMPPMLQVVMVALDESSAKRLQGSSTSAPAEISGALAGKFADPAKLDADLAALEQSLADLKLNYRVFNTTISIRGAKFSDQ